MKSLFLLGIVSMLAAPLASVAQTTVFQDTFQSGNLSTVNPTNASDATPTSTKTAYEIASSKNATTTTAASGALTLSTGATSSGYTEAQALFTTTPVTLNAVGQYIEIYYTFTNTANTFNGTAKDNSEICLGLYNSGGGSGPTNNILLWNGGIVNTATTATNGACKGWVGYTAEFAYNVTGTYSSAIGSRPAQTQANNSCQGLGYNSGYASGANVTTMTGVAGQPLLTVGNTYTMDMRIYYVNSTTLAITNTLYNGTGIGGTVFSAGGWTGQFGAQAASALTMTFDGLVVGYRPGTTSGATTIPISRITVAKYIPSVPTVTGLANQTVIAGNTATLSATVDGTPAPGLQWYLSTDGGISSNGISGATSSSYSFTAQQSQSGNIYYLVATNSQGTTVSSMTLSVISAPGISGLSPQSASIGDTVTLNATVTGTPTPALQWQLGGNNLTDGATGNGSTISGSSSATLTITTAQTADSGTYYLIATNTAGAVTNSVFVQVSAGATPPAIFGLTNQTVLAGNNTTLSASVSGSPIPGLQWYLSTDGGTTSNAIAGATTSSLGLTNVQYTQNGYQYILVATNSAGTAVSNMTLTVTQIAPTIAGVTNQTVDARFNVTFSATVGGAPAPVLQWSVNGTPITGATNTTLTLTNVQPLQNGYVYSLTATNTAGITTSNLTLTVTNALFNVQLNGLGTAYTGAGQIGSAGDVWNNPTLSNFDNSGTLHSTSTPIITGFSLADSRGAASPVTLSMTGLNYKSYYGTSSGHGEVAGLNNQSLKFDWTGATPVPSASITLAGLPPNTSLNLYGYGASYYTSPIGSYWAMGAANGDASANEVSTNSMDVTQSANQGICWIKIVGTTDSGGSLTVNVSPQTAGGVWWQTYVNGFQVQLHTAPLVTGLTNLTVIQGNSATLSPTISGVPSPTFQWQTNGVNVAGATNASLALNNVQYAQNGYVYSLISSNQAGVVTNSMTLTVLVTPSIAGLNNQTAITNDTVTISPTVSGVPTPSLQWQFNGVNLTDGATGNGSTISGSTSGTLTITSTQAADSGTYSLVASNSAGIVTNSMTLTVSAGDVAPGITGPSNQTVVQGSNATFTASVIGLPVPSLQWLDQTGTPITGATGSSLTLTNVSYAQNGYTYSLVASNSVGMVTNSATLTVLLPAYISASPTNLTVVVGTPATFSVTAGGDPAVSYQWNRNGSPIAGATSSSYTLSNPQGADNGVAFSVTVSNSVGLATGSATLTVLSTMTGTFLPTNGAVNISPDQQLRIVFAGGSPRLNTNGTFTVRDAADNSLVQTIDASQFLSYTPGNTSIQTIPNAAIRNVQGSVSGTGSGTTAYYYMPIALYGNEAWITLTNRLAYGHTYYATCDTGLFLDSTGASFSGVAGTNTWRLSTKASGPATPTASTGPTSITIGQDGAGDFATFQGAFDWIPQSNTLARTVHVLPGIYRDSATLAGNRNFVTIVGDGASRTNAQLIYPFAYFAPPNTVFTSGSLRIESSDVAVENLTVDNTIYNEYHPTGYASSGAAGAFAGAINTLATTGKRIVFDNVLIKGGQDTIYNITGIIYYHNCEVWGSVDFIYGAALEVFDQCNIVQIRSTGGPCTAPNTAYAQPYGITFLNCTFPQALVANGYPFDVGAATTTFMRPWGKDGMTAAINCSIGNQFNTAGWQTMGNTNETTCRAREYGTTMIGGGSAPTIAQRQAAGAYWANTIDPDYTNNPSLSVNDPLVYGPTGTNNRVAVTVNPSDYTLAAIFGNSYFNLNGWMPAVLPTITAQPTNQAVSHGQPATFTVAATGLPDPAYQWFKDGTPIADATNATLNIPNAMRTNAGAYSVVVSNTAGSVTSATATLTYNNTAPAAQTMTVSRYSGVDVKISFSSIATNWTDADGDSVVLESVSLRTTNGVTLYTNSTVIDYPASAAGVNDQISYTISDGFGGSGVGYINIVVTAPPAGPTISSGVVTGNPTAITAHGISGYQYVLERATTLSPADWTPVSTNAANTNGVINATDSFQDLGGNPPSQAYYRLRWNNN